MVSTQIALVNKDMSDSKVKAMLDEIDSLDGVEWSIAKAKITNGLVPDEMIDDDIKSIFESDKYQMIVINSSYETATNEENELVNKINDVIKKYDEDGILAGEAPLMKDLVEDCRPRLQQCKYKFNSGNIYLNDICIQIRFDTIHINSRNRVCNIC